MSKTEKNHYASNGEVSDLWGPPKVTPTGVSEQTLTAWLAIQAKVCGIARDKNWTRAELARRTGIPSGTLTPVLDGTYTGSYGNQVLKLQAWLDSLEEIAARVFGIPDEPSYFETPTSREVADTLLYAQQMPQMAVITLASGMGKSSTARHFRSRPGVHLVTMRPVTSRTHAMLVEIAKTLDVQERGATALDRAIGLKLKRNGRQTLLIVDESQNLSDEAINQLRYFFDEYRCGIALLGNEEIYTRFGKGDPREGFGQIHRRIGKRLRRMRPQTGDIAATLDAWGVADPESRKLLTAIGYKHGTLGQISETMKLALILAAGDGEELSARHVRLAWENRGGETLKP